MRRQDAVGDRGGPDLTGHRVEVAVQPPYTVHVGSGVLAELPRVVNEPRVAVFADANVAALHAQALLAALEAGGHEARLLTVPAGEPSKSLARFADLLQHLAADAFPRDGAVVALGGGVVGDLAGFVAASYMRGVAFYQAPTSLLAMVDASVGGKTGVDLPQGKNLVGAFWQPRAVVADVATLATLPEREFRQGTVELVKHGFLADPQLLATFQAGWSQDVGDARLAAAVARSVAVKAGVVARDEREGGVRAHLNLGHTLAHALEAASGQRLPHGDAVAYGLVYAGLLARRRGHADLLVPLLQLLEWVRPAPMPDTTFDELLAFMARDKKVAGGKLRFVLLEDVGRPFVADDLERVELEGAWRELLRLMV